MKEWLRLWIIERCGGYPDAESAIDAVEGIQERKRLLTLSVRRLFNTIGPEDILKIHADRKTWLFQGKPISEAEKLLLIAEAQGFLRSKLWQILRADVMWQSNRRTFLLAKDDLDMVAGKMMQYDLDCIDTRLKSMDKGLPLFNAKES